MSVYGSSATRDRQGWFLGLTGAQITLVLVAAAPAWIAMAVGHWVYLTLLVPGWMAIVGLVCLPIRGWSALQWLGVLVRHLVGTTLGWSRFQSAAASGHPLDADRSSANERSANHGERSRGRGAPDADRDNSGVEADLPGVLAGIRVHDGPPMTSSLLRPAIIQNQATRTWAVTARIVHPGIALSDNPDRTRMGAGLAELFEAATGANQIHLIAFQVRTIPDDGAERDEWVRRHAHTFGRATGDTGRGDILRDADGESDVSVHVNAQLELMTAGAAMRREAFVTVVVRETVIAREAKRAGGGAAGRARILYGLMGEVESRLTGAIGCTHVTWLDTAALAVAIRTGFEPGDSSALADAAIAHAHDDRVAVGVPLAAAGPVNAVPRMRCYQHGEWESTSSAILLPRKGAMIGALARALVPSQPGERRALTVFYRPVSQQSAHRTTGRAEMSAAMGAEMRRRIGRVERASDRHAVGRLRDRDETLETGRSLVHVTAVACATAATTRHPWARGGAPTDALSQSAPTGQRGGGATGGGELGRQLDASIRLCGFVPLPLDGAHDAAFAAAAIPLGAAPPDRRR